MNKPEPRNIQEVVSAIHGHQHFLVATHVRPDGDAVGSLLALTSMLHRLGKVVHPFSHDAVPSAQQFLQGAGEVRHGGADPSLYDAAILVDCGDLDRVGSSLVESVRRIPLLINIDHHLSSTPFGDVYWVDPSASSTCEMLYHLSRALDIPIDPEIASQLYTGLLTDTGSFRFSNTNQQVLELAAALVGAGADPARIAGETYDSASPQRLRLLAEVLATVEFHADYKLASAELALKMFSNTGTSPMDSEGFINELRSVRPVQVAMLFREEADGTVHVSLRSKGSADVAAFAKEHGGGGHRNAAAFRAAGSLERVRFAITREALDII